MTPERLAELDAAAPIIDAATDLECLIMEICGDVAELPDRTSPEDQPDMMMVNFEELRIILDTRLTPCVSAYPDLKAHIAALEAEVARMREALRNPPKHVYWGAGEPDCPRDILAGNGELHTLRCKVCGKGLSEGRICLAGLPQ